MLRAWEMHKKRISEAEQRAFEKVLASDDPKKLAKEELARIKRGEGTSTRSQASLSNAAGRVDEKE